MKDVKPPVPNNRIAFAHSRTHIAQDPGPSLKAPGNTGNRKEPRKPHNPAQAPNGRHHRANLPNLSLGLHRFSCRARRSRKKPLHRPTGSSPSLHHLTHRTGKLHNLEFKCFGSPIRLAFTVSFGLQPNFLWKTSHGLSAATAGRGMRTG